MPAPGSPPILRSAVWDLGLLGRSGIGAISQLRSQRTDVKVYGENGNAQGREHPRRLYDGDRLAGSFTEGQVMVKTLKQVLDQGAAWQPKAVEVPAVVVTKDSVDQFVKDHPDAVGN